MKLIPPKKTIESLLNALPKEFITKSGLIAELRMGYRKEVFGCWYQYGDDRTILYSGDICDSLYNLLMWTINEGYKCL